MVKMISSQRTTPHGQIEMYQQEQKVFSIGQPSNGKMYFILEGECLLSSSGKNAWEPNRTLKEGDFFGESALISSKPRHTTVEILSQQCKILPLNKKNLKQKLIDSPRFAYSIFRAISVRLLNLEAYLSQLISQSPKIKLELLETIHQPKIRLPDQKMLKFLETLPALTFEEGECIHTEEDNSQAIMYFLHTGQFTLEKQYNIENKLSLTFQDNHFFGETQLIGNRRLGHTVTVTQGPARVVPINETVFFQIIRLSPSFFTNQLQFVIWKLNTTEKAIRFLSAKKMPPQSNGHKKSNILVAQTEQVILQEGEKANDSMYFILEGDCGVYKQGIKLNTLHKGEFFGELGLISDEPRNAEIRVEGDQAKLMVLDSESLIEKTLAQPDFIFSILKANIARLYRAEVNIFSLVQKLPEMERNLAEKYEKARLKNKSVFDYIDSLQVKTYKMADSIFQDGEKQKDDLYIVLEGRIAITKEYNKKDIEITYLTDGDFFGEVALISGYPRYYSAYALDQSEVARLNLETFRQVIQEYPEFAYGLLRNIIWKFINLDRIKDKLNLQFDAYSA